MSQKYLIEVLICDDPHDLLKTSNTKNLCPNDPNVKRMTYIGYDLARNTSRLYWSSINAWGQEIRSSVLIPNLMSLEPKIESEKKQ